MPEVVVYGTRLSPFVEKTVRGVQRKKLDFELVEPKTPMEIRKWNPVTGKMPVADVRGERLYDSTFILRKLDELYPEPPLLSRDAAVAAQQRQLEDWADESLYWYTMALRWTDRHAGRSADQILGDQLPSLLRPLLRRVIRRQIGGMTRAQGMGRIPEDVLLREYGSRLDDLLRMLGSRPFFYADEPSLADLAVYGQLAMARSGPTPELDRVVTARPAMVDYLKRVEQATGG